VHFIRRAAIINVGKIRMQPITNISFTPLKITAILRKPTKPKPMKKKKSHKKKPEPGNYDVHHDAILEFK